jgi:hypothetical protein
MGRWIRFLIAILLGIVIGLIYGWVFNPVQYVDTAPDSLREDFRTDYVLMVAEAYQAEEDLSVAVRRLAMLGDAPAREIVRRALLFAEDVGYAESDLELMRTLEDDLQAWNPAVGGSAE